MSTPGRLGFRGLRRGSALRSLIAATLLALVACTRTTEGPTPTVLEATNPLQPGLSPARLCNAQGTAQQGASGGWRVELSGDGFAPKLQEVLTGSPRVEMPTVALEGPVSLSLPRESVFFESPRRLVLQVPTLDTSPALELPPGDYALTVTNPQGASGRKESAVRVVPPPTLSEVSAPEGLSPSNPSPLVLTGSGFREGEPPTVVLRNGSQQDIPLTDITVYSATELRAALPANTPAGTYDVVLTNPEGCGTTRPGGLRLSYALLGALALEPRSGWELRDQPITLSNTPATGQRPFTVAPRVFLVAVPTSNTCRMWGGFLAR